MNARIIIIGPAHPLRGGLATFNQRLATEFIRSSYDCSIYSFSLQYPSFLFPGKTQYSNEPAPKGIKIFSVINSVNPLNWIRIGNRLRKEKPDIIVVRYWLPFMGPALGTILRRVRKNLVRQAHHTKIICIADNIIPHEKRFGDKSFTKYFLKCCDAFITMSEKVTADLRTFQKEKPARLVQHPLYDSFGEIISKEEAREKLKINNEELIILFFGFIRKYKGLDLLLQAMADERIKKSGIKLLIAGEFYEDRKPYFDLIEKLRIKDQLILRTDFIPESEVKYYFCAADAVVQPYRNATQSGVTPLAYHFEKPMIITNVGGLPALVPDGKAGIVAEADSQSIANAILKFYSMDPNSFIPYLQEEKKKLSWSNLVNTILELSKNS